MFAIVVNEKGGEQKRLEFDKPEVTIGRVQGNDIILPKGNVSKRHSRIVLKDGKFIIVDLKSTNGTYVNGRKITSPLVVKGSDKIYIGDFILSIEELGASAQAGPPADEPPPPLRGKPTVPPPPPRRAPSADYDAAHDEDESADAHGAHDAPDSDDEDEMPPPPEPVAPPRPARPSSVDVAVARQPAPLPPSPAPAPRPVTARPVPAPVSRQDLPAARPTAAPRPTPAAVVATPPVAARPAPAPAPARPLPAPTPAPARRPAAPVLSISVDEGRRAKLTEVMRELSTRLCASLGIASGAHDTTAEEDLWSRAENTASDLLEQLSSDGSLPPGVDTDALLKDVVAETVGTGPLEELLADDSVREIAIPRHDRIFVDRGGSRELGQKWFSSGDAVTRAVERLLQRAGRAGELAAAQSNGALLEARIDGGLLLTCALPPLAARGPSVTIRRPRRNLLHLTDLVGEGILSQGMADFLELGLKARKNVLVSGPAGSGRSTVLAAMARGLVESGERVVSVEEAEELELGEGPWIPLVGRGAGLRHAMHAALRLKPERLVVGDLRGADALDLIGALAGGTDGALCAVQAGSPREALARLESLARLAVEAPAAPVLADELGRGVSLIVHLTRGASGELRVGEITEVRPGDPGEGPTLHPIFTFKPDQTGGRFAATGHVPAWAEGAPPSTFR
ncbi:MAG TPA: ATPase, T2SS/T4P/T4SS family [Polyangia bacterium]